MRACMRVCFVECVCVVPSIPDVRLDYTVRVYFILLAYIRSIYVCKLDASAGIGHRVLLLLFLSLPSFVCFP